MKAVPAPPMSEPPPAAAAPTFQPPPAPRSAAVAGDAAAGKFPPSEAPLSESLQSDAKRAAATARKSEEVDKLQRGTEGDGAASNGLPLASVELLVRALNVLKSPRGGAKEKSDAAVGEMLVVQVDYDGDVDPYQAMDLLMAKNGIVLSKREQGQTRATVQEDAEMKRISPSAGKDVDAKSTPQLGDGAARPVAKAGPRRSPATQCFFVVAPGDRVTSLLGSMAEGRPLANVDASFRNGTLTYLNLGRGIGGPTDVAVDAGRRKQSDVSTKPSGSPPADAKPSEKAENAGEKAKLAVDGSDADRRLAERNGAVKQDAGRNTGGTSGNVWRAVRLFQFDEAWYKAEDRPIDSLATAPKMSGDDSRTNSSPANSANASPDKVVQRGRASPIVDRLPQTAEMTVPLTSEGFADKLKSFEKTTAPGKPGASEVAKAGGNAGTKDELAGSGKGSETVADGVSPAARDEDEVLVKSLADMGLGKKDVEVGVLMIVRTGVNAAPSTTTPVPAPTPPSVPASGVTPPARAVPPANP